MYMNLLSTKNHEPGLPFILHCSQEVGAKIDTISKRTSLKNFVRTLHKLQVSFVQYKLLVDFVRT